MSRPRPSAATPSTVPRFPRRRLAAMLLALGPVALRAAGRTSPARPAPTVPAPVLSREFRGMWIATKGNIDWPSDTGLPVTQQQQELRQLLDSARQMRLNAVILQVRPQCDALYESQLEPWSEVLTGRQGIPPAPRWDPLAFAVQEAHARGLELHAWVNPFRARSDASRSPLNRNHIINQHPEYTVRHGSQIWLDPGVPGAREHSLRVIIDIVQRYDIDALHMDDYFYPYPLPQQPFPDNASYERYRRSGGRLDRSNWRRQNVDGFVQQLGSRIRQQKPWVKFGISPFGIWRPGHPTGIKGLDAYETLASDAVKWFRLGWVDYLTPQLYWPIDRPEQSFATLLPWWAGQNPLGRHLWPGLDATRIGQDRNPAEIQRQILLARGERRAGGVALWNASVLRANRQGIATLLTERMFSAPALVPASPWMKESAPGAAILQGAVESGGRRIALKWRSSEGSPVRQFALQYRVGRQWFTQILASAHQSRVFDRGMRHTLPDEVVLTPIGRTGMPGPAARWRG